MKKITILSLLLLSSLSFVAQNLLTNPGFESGTSLTLPWNVTTPGTVSVVTDDTGSGSTNVIQGTGGFYFEQAFKVTPGVTYRISLKYKWLSGGVATGTFGYPVIRKFLSGTDGVTTSFSIMTSDANDSAPDAWVSRSVATFVAPSDSPVVRFVYDRPSATAKSVRLDDIAIKVEPTVTWNGSANDGNLENTSNWSTNALPISTDVILIPTGLTSYPSTGNLSVAHIFVDHGATFISNGTVAGEMHYYVGVNDNNWHLISSAGNNKADELKDNWIASNGVASGTLNNRGIATYQNGTPNETTGPWEYFQAGSTVTFNPIIGYSMKRIDAGLYSFNGNSYNQAPEDITITQGTSNNWNLIGNPFTSYLDISSFLSTNAAALNDLSEAVYVWNAATSTYNALTTGYIHPGQGFFVNSALASTTVTVTAAMESHQSSATFYKSEGNPSVKLMLSSGSITNETAINYLEGKTKGLDPRFDVSLFDGVASDLKLYTNLLEGYEETAFMKQALPNSDFETMIIPVGIKAAAGQEITFSAEAMNLPEGIKVFLEDRENNTITRLDESNSSYKVTLVNAIDGNGRFFLHTKASGVLGTGDVALENVSIYKTSNATLRVVGLENGTTSNIKMYNVTGKQVLNSNFQSKGAVEISLPKLATGIYIVQLQNENGRINKKIILE